MLSRCFLTGNSPKVLAGISPAAYGARVGQRGKQQPDLVGPHVFARVPIDRIATLHHDLMIAQEFGEIAVLLDQEDRSGSTCFLTNSVLTDRLLIETGNCRFRATDQPNFQAEFVGGQATSRAPEENFLGHD